MRCFPSLVGLQQSLGHCFLTARSCCFLLTTLLFLLLANLFTGCYKTRWVLSLPSHPGGAAAPKVGRKLIITHCRPGGPTDLTVLKGGGMLWDWAEPLLHCGAAQRACGVGSWRLRHSHGAWCHVAASWAVLSVPLCLLPWRVGCFWAEPCTHQET